MFSLSNLMITTIISIILLTKFCYAVECKCDDFFNSTRRKANFQSPSGYTLVLSRLENNFIKNSSIPSHSCTSMDCDGFRNLLYFQAIDKNAFRDFTNLKTLVLSNNLINILCYDNFNGLDQLTELDLSHNSLDNLLSRRNFESIDNSSCESNDILNNDATTNITAKGHGVFRKLVNLLYLNLTFNVIGYKNDLPFDGLTNLRSLLASSNLLIEVKPKAFNGLPRLTSLALDSNKLISIPAFDDSVSLPNLKYLNLTDNKIARVGDDTFTKLANLTTLDLNNNQISSIQQNAFKNLVHLTALYMANNFLSNIPSALNPLFVRGSGRKVINNANDTSNNITGANWTDIYIPANNIVSTLTLDMTSNTLAVNNLHADMTLYLQAAQNTVQLSKNLAFDFSNCCANQSLSFYNTLKHNYEMLGNATDKGVLGGNSSCVLVTFQPEEQTPDNNTDTILLTNRQKIMLHDFSTDYCQEIVRNCVNLTKFHYFDEEYGVCVDKIEECMNGEQGVFAHFDKTADNGQGKCENLQTLCLNRGPFQNFDENTLQCTYDEAKAKANCASKGQSLQKGDETGTCVDKQNSYMGNKVAAIVGGIGAAVFILVIVLGTWYYRHYKRRIKQKDLDLLNGLTPEQYVQDIGGDGIVEIVSDDQYLNDKNVLELRQSNSFTYTSSGKDYDRLSTSVSSYHNMHFCKRKTFKFGSSEYDLADYSKQIYKCTCCVTQCHDHFHSNHYKRKVDLDNEQYSLCSKKLLDSEEDTNQNEYSNALTHYA
eukprot:Pgem_evm1s3900